MMDGYSYIVDEKEKENLAFARAEGVEASYKDLSQVCGRINGRKVAWALDFLQKAVEGGMPILYKKFNTNLGHRHELGGSKGRYPKKAALAVLKAIKSAAANARIKGLSEDLTIVHVLANKKDSMPRMQSKGRRFRSDYETARIEVIVKGPLAIEKKIEVKEPEKKQEVISDKQEAKSDSGKQDAIVAKGNNAPTRLSHGDNVHIVQKDNHVVRNEQSGHKKLESKPEIHHETKVQVKQEKDHIKKETYTETKNIDLSKLKRRETKK